MHCHTWKLQSSRLVQRALPALSLARALLGRRHSNPRPMSLPVYALPELAGDFNMLMEWTKWSTIGKRIVCYIWVKRVNECSRWSINLDREILPLGEPNVSRQHPTVTHHGSCIDASMPRQQHPRASRMQEQFVIRGQCIDIVFSPFKNQT